MNTLNNAQNGKIGKMCNTLMSYHQPVVLVLMKINCSNCINVQWLLNGELAFCFPLISLSAAKQTSYGERCFATLQTNSSSSALLPGSSKQPIQSRNQKLVQDSLYRLACFKLAGAVNANQHSHCVLECAAAQSHALFLKLLGPLTDCHEP